MLMIKYNCCNENYFCNLLYINSAKECDLKLFEE